MNSLKKHNDALILEKSATPYPPGQLRTAAQTCQGTTSAAKRIGPAPSALPLARSCLSKLSPISTSCCRGDRSISFLALGWRRFWRGCGLGWTWRWAEVWNGCFFPHCQASFLGFWGGRRVYWVWLSSCSRYFLAASDLKISFFNPYTAVSGRKCPLLFY